MCYAGAFYNISWFHQYYETPCTSEFSLYSRLGHPVPDSSFFYTSILKHPVPDCFLYTPPEILLVLPSPGEYRDPGLRQGGCNLVLSTVDITCRPANLICIIYLFIYYVIATTTEVMLVNPHNIDHNPYIYIVVCIIFNN